LYILIVYIIDSKKFHEALKAKGYTTLGAFAKELKIHRNTLHYYLSGNGVFPVALNQILERLELKPEEILIEKEKPLLKKLEPISELIEKLQKEFPQITFVLFGSRAVAKAGKYADWDIGVFSAEGIAHDDYRQIKRAVSEIIENSPHMVDLINLNNADSDFLKRASKGWMFLGGKLKDWMVLNQKADEETKNIH